MFDMNIIFEVNANDCLKHCPACINFDCKYNNNEIDYELEINIIEYLDTIPYI